MGCLFVSFERVKGDVQQNLSACLILQRATLEIFSQQTLNSAYYSSCNMQVQFAVCFLLQTYKYQIQARVLQEAEYGTNYLQLVITSLQKILITNSCHTQLQKSKHLIPLQSPIQVAHKQLLVLTYRTHRLLLATFHILQLYLDNKNPPELKFCNPNPLYSPLQLSLSQKTGHISCTHLQLHELGYPLLPWVLEVHVIVVHVALCWDKTQ